MINPRTNTRKHKHKHTHTPKAWINSRLHHAKLHISISYCNRAALHPTMHHTTLRLKNTGTNRIKKTKNKKCSNKRYSATYQMVIEVFFVIKYLFTTHLWIILDKTCPKDPKNNEKFRSKEYVQKHINRMPHVTLITKMVFPANYIYNWLEGTILKKKN